MKKQALYIFFASLVLVLSGCGSNDKLDSQYSTSANKSVTLKTDSKVSGKDFNLSVIFTKNLSSDYALALKNFRLLSVGGCKVQSVDLPDPFEMKGGKGSTRSVLFSGTFKDKCEPTEYKIEFTQELHKGDREPKTETIEYDTEGPGTGGGTASPANGFYNATTPMAITQANHEYEIKVQVLEDGYAVSGKEVKLKPFESIYGDIANPTATTGNDGYAVFNYTSPTVLPANGTSKVITLTHDDNGTRISQDIVLEFNAAGGGGSQYSLVNPTTPINVTAPNETQEISVYVVDTATQVGVSGKEVSITTIANGYGSVNTATARTDSAGKASFEYTAPSTLSGLTSTTATLSFVESGITMQQTVQININPAAGESNTIQVLPLDSNVSADAEAKPINVYVKDSTGRPAANVEVVVEFFNARFGTMNKYEERTDNNGHIEFVYIAPADIEPLDGQAFDFNISVKSDPSAVQTVHIGFHKSVVISPVADIYIAPNDMTIVRAGETRAIRITTVDSRNYAVSADLKIENPAQNGKDYGTFDVANFATDALGNYTVTYTAPANLTGLAERNISIVELGTNLEKTLTIHFQQPANTEKSYDLNLTVDDSIAVDSSGTLGIVIHETGKPGDYIAKADVVNVKMTTKFPKMLLFDANATEVSYAGENSNSLALYAQHLSGVAVVIVEATVYNGVRNVVLKQEFPVVITSGPISSMSMFHSRNSFDANNGVYRDYYTIHAVDKYGNPVQEGTALHPTLINGVKEQNVTGAITGGAPSVFADANADFGTIVDNAGATAGDRLIILPSPGKTSKYYMGDWSIKSHTATTLTLDEQYDDVAESGLSYVAGNESREVTVNGVSLTVTADISSPNDSFKTDTSGNMEFVVSYDPALKGKIFYLAANGPSGTKRIGTALKSSFFYGGYQLRTLISEITLTQPGDSFMTGFYVLDSVGNTYEGQFNARINEFDGSKGGFSIDNTKKEFTYYAPSNPDDFSALIGTTYEFNLTISESDETFQTIKVHYTSGKDYTNYTISSADENFTISAPNQEYLLSLYVSDGTKAVQGESVSIDFLDPYDGSFQAYQATTDASGRAVFAYVAPSDLALLYANPVAIHAYLTNNRPTDVNVTALFVQDTATYALSNENNITINYPSQSKEIAVQLTKNGVPQAGEMVVAKSIPAAYGSITNASVTTGTDGYARFTYIAPATLAAGTQPLELVYTDSNGVEISAISTITIDPLAHPFEFGATTTLLEVNTDNENKTISAMVVDQNGVGVKDIDVSITAISDIKYGAIVSASTIKTNDSGRATFVYKAPDSIADVDGNSTTVKLFLTDDTTIEKNITINFAKIDENVTVPKVVLANIYKEINITQNSQNVQIEVQVFDQGTNTPYTEGNVKVSLPHEVLDGVEVGSFSTYIVAVGSNGRAVFNYTGPQDLQTLLDNNDTNATFEFFHEANPTQKESATVVYDLQAGYIPANYILTTSSSDGKQTIDLNKLKAFTLYLKDDQGTLIDDDKINTVTIVSKNVLVGKLVDATDGSEVDTLTFNGASAVNSKSFSVKTNTLSGLLPIEIIVEFTDANGDSQTKSIIMNTIVLSGPPTALSISYAGVEQNSTIAKYTEKFAVTVTDAYNNPVNTRPFIATGAIVEYAVDGSSASGDRTTMSPRLWHGTSDPRGELEALGGNKAQFTTTSDVFNHVDISNDRLVVFGAGYVYEALGKWDLDSVDPQLLGLKDGYYGTTRSDLGFAVGHNNRQDLCSGDQREYVGNMKSDRYQIDENGHALIEFEYDYHLTGKDIMVWVNLTGFQSDDNTTGRIGEAQKHTLRGNGLYPVPTNGYQVPKNTTRHGATFEIHHENAPEWYINGKFGWAVKAGSTCGWSVEDTSNNYDPRSCYGAAYISFTLTAPVDKDCTFAIEGINTATEFTSVNSH